MITLDEELQREDPIKEIRKIFGEDPSLEIDLESGHFSTPGSYAIPRTSYLPAGNPTIRRRR
ncbi:MAG: hypothetical protein GH144_01290 [Clostridia bacterium]|jgi:hypothetical protein|nr:hypothetical protein [Clostridia bacterium]